jgi:hypothetical protein
MLQKLLLLSKLLPKLQLPLLLLPMLQKLLLLAKATAAAEKAAAA